MLKLGHSGSRILRKPHALLLRMASAGKFRGQGEVLLTVFRPTEATAGEPWGIAGDLVEARILDRLIAYLGDKNEQAKGSITPVWVRLDEFAGLWQSTRYQGMTLAQTLDFLTGVLQGKHQSLIWLELFFLQGSYGSAMLHQIRLLSGLSRTAVSHCVAPFLCITPGRRSSYHKQECQVPTRKCLRTGMRMRTRG